MVLKKKSEVGDWNVAWERGVDECSGIQGARLGSRYSEGQQVIAS